MFVQVWAVSPWLDIFVGLCVQRALESCDQSVNALSTIVSITDNLLGAILQGATHNNTLMCPSAHTNGQIDI